MYSLYIRNLRPTFRNRIPLNIRKINVSELLIQLADGIVSLLELGRCRKKKTDPNVNITLGSVHT